MLRISMAALAALTLVAGTGQPAAADEKAFLGVWKVNVALMSRDSGRELTLCLIQVRGSDGKYEVTFVKGGPESFQDGSIASAEVTPEALRFDVRTDAVTLHAAAYAPKDEKRPRELAGSVSIRSQRELLRLEKTLQKELSPDELVRPMEGLEALRKARTTKDSKEADSILSAAIKEGPGKPVAYYAAQRLLQLREKEDAPAEDLREAADEWAKTAARYGPELERHVSLEIGRMLVLSEAGLPVALDYARKAAQGLKETAPLGEQAAVLKLLRDALVKKEPRGAEVKELNTRLETIEAKLDEEFKKSAVPFEVKKYAGRKGEGSRVALVELFTGAHCPPCVSADIAFDALLRTYSPEEVIFLQYHLHVPRPDPLTNADAEKREEFYGQDVRGTPTMMISGRVAPPVGGFRPQALERYEELRPRIEKVLETEAGAALALNVERKGDRLTITARVKDAARTGEDIRLRLVLVEDTVRYAGNNGQRLHHHVVRAFPGGVDGLAVKEKTAEQKATVSLLDLTRSLQDYLIAANEKHPFLDNERPLALEKLKVVAFLQNDISKDILQAVQVDVPAEE